MIKKYLKMPLASFEQFNVDALKKYINSTKTEELPEGDTSATQYTFFRPDANPLDVWAIVEHDFIEGDLKTQEEAIALGLVITVNVEDE